MAEHQNLPNNGRLSLSAGLLLLLVCAIWGGNAVSIKFSNQGIPPLMAATIRSVAAGFLVLLLAKYKGQTILFPKGSRFHALMIGFLFGLDFLFLYWSVSFTTASRATIFLYSHPFWVAIGAHFALKQDRLRPGKVSGLILAFIGLWIVFRIHSTGRRCFLGCHNTVYQAHQPGCDTQSLPDPVRAADVCHPGSFVGNTVV